MEIIVIIIIALVAYLISQYNFFKKKEQQIKREKSGIDVALTNRSDTMQKMFDAVQGYTKHEKNTFIDVVKVRNGMTVQEMLDVENQMNKAYSQFNVLVESYPELRSSENFQKLQDAINSTEAELQAARRCYNATVTEYNEKVVSFPTNFVAQIFGIKTMDVYEASYEKREDFKLNF